MLTAATSCTQERSGSWSPVPVLLPQVLLLLVLLLHAIEALGSSCKTKPGSSSAAEGSKASASSSMICCISDSAATCTSLEAAALHCVVSTATISAATAAGSIGMGVAAATGRALASELAAAGVLGWQELLLLATADRMTVLPAGGSQRVSLPSSQSDVKRSWDCCCS